MSDREPFDPCNPFDAAAELFRRQITQMILDAEKITIYRDLDPKRQIECFVAGALTAIIGVCFASIKPDGRDYIMDYLAQSLPTARMFAENICSSDERGDLPCPESAKS